MIPAGITTATVHLDAPVSFTGDPGRLHVVIEPSTSLIWTATGTPLGSFIDTFALAPGKELEVELPHTDQAGFEDGFGNAYTGWYYTATVVYEKDGRRINFLARDFQVPTGQVEVDLALVPAGEAVPVPQTAPIQPVTSIAGFNGAVTLADLGLDVVDNTADAAKPVSAAQQAALDLKLDIEKSRIIRKISRTLLDRFPRPTGIAVGMSGTTVCLYQEVTRGKWWRTELPALSFAGGGAVHQITGQYIAQAFALVPSNDAGIVYAGGTWYGNPGDVRNARAAGLTASWTSPATATDLLLVTSTSTNGGLAKVTVDGSATAANQLMTAQQVVDNGWYPNTILVANGGTLNPTDRVLDFNSASLVASTNVLLATGLSAAAHPVVITSTNYYRVGKTATDIRTNIYGFGSAAGQALGAPGTTATITETISTVSSAWEYALKTRITAEGSSDFLGNVHGYENETSSVIRVDGVVTAVADGAIATARDNITYTRTTWLSHPQSAGAKVADVTTVYTLSRDGIAVEVTVTWAVPGWLDTAYLMMPLPGTSAGASAFDRVDLLENAAGPQTQTGTDGTIYRGRSKSAAAWAWQSKGRHAVGMWADDALAYTNNWANSGVIDASFEDRGGALTKLYLAKVATPAAGLPFAAGEVHYSKVHYVMARLDSPEQMFGQINTSAISTATQAALDGKLAKDDFNMTVVSALLHGVRPGNTAAANTTALTAAITAANTAGSAVMLPAGTLALNSITTTVPLYGSGKTRTIINGGRITIGANNITLADFKLVSSDLYAVTASQKSNVVLRNLDISHSGALELALQSDRVDKLTVTGCTFAVGGLELITTNDFLIEGNYWDAQYLNVNEPLHITQQSSGIVSDNTIKNTMTDAIDLYSSGEYCVINGNRFYGLKGACGIEVKVTMSDVAGNSSGPGNVIDGVVISNNILKDFSRNTAAGGLAGIYAEFVDSRAVPTYAVTESGRAIIITGNVLEDFNVADPGFAAHYNGITFTGHNGIVSNNVIRNIRAWNGAAANGIAMGYSGVGQKNVGVRVSGNVIAGIENGNGIHVGNLDQCQISDNIIRQDDVTGIQTKHGLNVITGVTLNHCTIEGNTFACNTATSYGIRSSFGTSVLNRCNIQGNIFKDCAILITVAQYCSFLGNTIENGLNSQASGVGLTGTSCRGNSYVGNHITMSADYALSLIDHDGFVISSNTFNSTNRAVLLNGACRNGALDNNISISQTNPEFPHYSGVSTADQNTMGVGMNNVNGSWKQAPFLISANGTRYQLTVGDDGALTTTAL